MDAEDDQTAAPAIVMVAVGTEAAALVLPPNAELGRRIAATGVAREVADERMSRDHARVRWSQGTWTITDLDSRNGTFVNGERITGDVRKRNDAVVRLGHTVFALLADGHGHPATYRDALVVGPELARAHARIRHSAGADTLLVQGETGCGKQVAARLWHAAGPRKAGPFVAVNCAAIPDGVAERLLFGGHKGAVQTIGHFQMARGGTLFLDDIDDLDATAQAALWRLLDSGAPRELGLVAGGHHLRTAIADSRLRADLYSRLARTAVQLPALRDRRVDIARFVQRELPAPHAKLVESCMVRPWPGNVTELLAALHRAAGAAAEANRDIVRIEDLPETAGMPPGTTSGETAVERKHERALAKPVIEEALARANGVVSVAARALGLHRSQLYRLLEEHGIAHDDG